MTSQQIGIGVTIVVAATIGYFLYKKVKAHTGGGSASLDRAADGFDPILKVAAGTLPTTGSFGNQLNASAGRYAPGKVAPIINADGYLATNLGSEKSQFNPK